MKYFLFTLSGIILIVLSVVSIFYYQNTKEMDLSSLAPPHTSEPPSTESKELHIVNPDDPIFYSLQDDELNISFNQGKDWTTVPVTLDELFSGEYNGNRQELIEDSYFLTENLVGFLYPEGQNLESQRVVLLYSTDQGETWEETTVKEPFPGMRFRKVDFLNEDFGYIIISGGRTMSEEGSFVFLTHDGGESWQETTNLGVTRLISNGGFVDESTGFITFETINSGKPELYVTQDAGQTWKQASLQIPEEYNEIFIQAGLPVQEEDHLSLLVNQGPYGDYQGGLVEGKFISEDNGETWEFEMEVEPNE